MSAPSFKAIADATLQAIYDLTTGGKQEARVGDQSYSAMDVEKLWKQYELAKQNAERAGEITPDANKDKVAVSFLSISDTYTSQR